MFVSTRSPPLAAIDYSQSLFFGEGLGLCSHTRVGSGARSRARVPKVASCRARSWASLSKSLDSLSALEEESLPIPRRPFPTRPNKINFSRLRVPHQTVSK